MVPFSGGLPRSQLPMRRMMIVPRRRLVFLRRPSRRLVFMPPRSMVRRRLPVCKYICLKWNYIDLSNVYIKCIWHIIDETLPFTYIFIHFRYDEQKKDSVMSSSDISPTIIQKSWTLTFDVIKRASLVYMSCHKLFVDCAVTVLIVYCAVTVLIVYLLTFVYIHSCFFSNPVDNLFFQNVNKVFSNSFYNQFYVLSTS